VEVRTDRNGCSPGESRDTHTHAHDRREIRPREREKERKKNLSAEHDLPSYTYNKYIYILYIEAVVRFISGPRRARDTRNFNSNFESFEICKMDTDTDLYVGFNANAEETGMQTRRGEKKSYRRRIE